MRFVLEVITPAKAKKYLAKNTANRRVRTTWIKRLASIIDNDQWIVTHHGIAFDSKGVLRDGQHRLMAIMEANRAVKMWVAYDVPDDVVLGIDQPGVRDVVDISGPLLGSDGEITKDDVSTARQMWYSVSRVGFSHQLTNQQVLRYVIDHRDAIRFACENIRHKDCRHSCLRAPVARAWYTSPQDRLAEFCECLKTGVAPSPQDRPAVVLRTLFVNSRTTFNGAGGRSILYRKTESALRSFLARKPIAKLYEVDSEIFPIPGDEDFDGSACGLPLVPGDDIGGVQRASGRHSEAWAARPDHHS